MSVELAAFITDFRGCRPKEEAWVKKHRGRGERRVAAPDRTDRRKIGGAEAEFTEKSIGGKVLRSLPDGMMARARRDLAAEME